MQKSISILGSTGSIGRQTLDVIRACGIRAAALTANRDVERMETQCREFRPALAVMMDPAAAGELQVRLADTGIRVASGMEGLLEAATLPEADTVITAVVGIVGLRPTMAAIRAGKRIGLANKETLVCAGELVMDEADRWGTQIVPVDSEHSAIFQCLQGCRDEREDRSAGSSSLPPGGRSGERPGTSWKRSRWPMPCGIPTGLWALRSRWTLPR